MMQDCPRYDRCSASFCPLFAGQDFCIVLKEDKKCKLLKATRFALGEGLPRHGLTRREFAGKQLSDKIKNESA